MSGSSHFADFSIDRDTGRPFPVSLSRLPVSLSRFPVSPSRFPVSPSKKEADEPPRKIENLFNSDYYAVFEYSGLRVP